MMASQSNKLFDEYEFRLDIDIPQEFLSLNNQDNGTTHLSPKEQSQAIESDSNISQNDTNHNSLESENQSSGDENDTMQGEIDDEIDNDDELPYAVDDTEPRENLPHYPIYNKIFEVHKRDVNWKRKMGTVDPLVDHFYLICPQLLT